MNYLTTLKYSMKSLFPYNKLSLNDSFSCILIKVFFQRKQEFDSDERQITSNKLKIHNLSQSIFLTKMQIKSIIHDVSLNRMCLKDLLECNSSAYTLSAKDISCIGKVCITTYYWRVQVSNFDKPETCLQIHQQLLEQSLWKSMICRGL